MDAADNMYNVHNIYCLLYIICIYMYVHILFTAKNKNRYIILCMLYSADKIVYNMNSV